MPSYNRACGRDTGWPFTGSEHLSNPLDDGFRRMCWAGLAYCNVL